MYLWFAIISGLIGGFLSIMMRIELAEPGIQLFTGLTFRTSTKKQRI